MKYIDFYERLAGFGRVGAYFMLALALILFVGYRFVEWLEGEPVVIGSEGVYVPFWVRWFRRV